MLRVLLSTGVLTGVYCRVYPHYRAVPIVTDKNLASDFGDVAISQRGLFFFPFQSVDALDALRYTLTVIVRNHACETSQVHPQLISRRFCVKLRADFPTKFFPPSKSGRQGRELTSRAG